MVSYKPVEETDGQDVTTPKISPEKMQVIRKLSWVVCLSFTFMIAQAVGGYFANSLAVMSDAAHLFSDVVGYAMSLLAVYCSTWKPTPEMTFGFIRAEILGAFLSVMFLWLVLYHLVMEAIERLSSPESVNGPVMFGVSLAGLSVNLIMGFVLMYSGHGHSHGLRKCDHDHGDADSPQECSQHHHCTSACNHNVLDDLLDDLSFCRVIPCSEGLDGVDSSCKKGDLRLTLGKPMQCVHRVLTVQPQSSLSDVELGTPTIQVEQFTPTPCPNDQETNMNIRAAIIHIVADTLQAVGVVISSALIWYDPDTFALADPICTLLFSVVGFGCSLNIMSDIFNIFMLRTPKTIDVAELEKSLYELDARIMKVDNIRIWSLTLSDTVMTCDLQTRSSTLNSPSFIQSVKDTAKLFGITQVTCCVENSRTNNGRGPSFGHKLKFGSSKV